MNFRQIEAFRAIVTAGSVTRAAEYLDISQPAVSRLLSDLEKEVGFRLFTRRGRRLVQTTEGRALYADVDRAFTGLEDIRSAAAAIRDYRSGTLNLVTMPSLASRLLPELIAAFAAAAPDIGIWLEVLPRNGVLQAVGSGRYDAGIATGPVADESISATRLCEVEAYCVLPVGHRLAGRRAIRLKDLRGERFISLARDSLFRRDVERMFVAAGVRCRNDIQARTADAIYGLVAAGLGVSIVGPDVPRELRSRQIVFKPLSPAVRMPIDLLTPGGEAPTRLAQSFARVVVDSAPRIAKSVGRGARRAA